MENKKAQSPRNSYIKFDVAVRDHFRCTDTAIAFSRLLMWSKKKDGFFKFKRACAHKLYRVGDSWSEELNIHDRRNLKVILDKLVNHHRSKTRYLQAEDKFQDKMFASYSERTSNLTYYFINREAVKEFLSSLNVKNVSLPSQKQAHVSSPPSPAPVDNFSEAQKNLPTDNIGNAQISPPLAHEVHNTTNTQTNTTLVDPSPAQPVTIEEEEKLSSKAMVEIWNSHAMNKAKWYPSIASRLCKILHDFFGNCLETFKTYCSAVASSSFCTGKASNSKFKAFLFWAIKPDVIKTILSGGYGVKAIVSQISMMSDQGKLEAEIRSIDHKILMTEKAIERAKDEVVKAQELSIAEYVVKMDEEKKKLILDIVEERLDSTFPTPDFSERIRQSMYRVWEKSEVEEYARIQLGFCKEEDIAAPQELVEKLNDLINKKNSNIKLLRIVEKENEKVKQTLENACEGVC
jgi:hypothetical protein